uniref:Secreted protein n=1 Tax=Manihot esculenta TaxID=3983 RepID=A0A199U9U9_MANES
MVYSKSELVLLFLTIQPAQNQVSHSCLKKVVLSVIVTRESTLVSIHAVVMGVYKCALCRRHTICSKKVYLYWHMAEQVILTDVLL